MATKETRILVVEDEAIIRKDIVSQLIKLGYAVCGEARDAVVAYTVAQEVRPDLVLMDIELADGFTGIDAARRIHEELKIPTVFLTANTDNTTRQKASLAEPYGFIVKPFSGPTLRAAIELAVYRSDGQRESQTKHTRLFNLASGRTISDAMYVKHEGLHVRVQFDQIQYIEALRDYVGIHMGQRRYVVYSAMQKMEDLLPADRFLRVHRSFIVRIDAIEAIEEHEILLENSTKRIPIGDTFYRTVLDRFGPV